MRDPSQAGAGDRSAGDDSSNLQHLVSLSLFRGFSQKTSSITP